ncbi:phosphatase PAP2 family protein [Aquihabitans sp. McL0605]|uniref:phosphatase PAP2 family protein n=1 Tax=Aquihabitans sp. McL0605 TaxID=3415671 RepID=UPI003CF07F74
MPWPSWNQAAVAALVLAVVALVARRFDHPKAKTTAAVAQEVALVSFLYMLWRLARQLPLTHEQGAEERGRWIYRFQRSVHLPSELSMEHWLKAHHWAATLTVDYYATVHVPALICFLVWMWVRHPDDYPRWRNVLAITTGFCLFIRFIRVAPPRLLPDLGFYDIAAQMGHDIYGPAGTGASDQFAAMPSIHIAWAAIVGFGVWTVTKSRFRIVGPLHLVLTFWAVMATANHWWLDGLVAMALVGIALLIDSGVRTLVSRRRRPTASAPAPPTPELVATG